MQSCLCSNGIRVPKAKKVHVRGGGEGTPTRESKVRILMKEVWGVREEREVKRSVWDARWRVAGADVHHMNRTRVV